MKSVLVQVLFLFRRKQKASQLVKLIGLTDAEKKVILNAHNADRSIEASQGPYSASNMMKMYWSLELANMAQTYADKCIYQHSDATQFSIGENLFITTKNISNEGVGTAVESWYNEKVSYHITSDTCDTVCGHYKQVVWAGASKVGCGLRQCENIMIKDGVYWPNAYYIVCNYDNAVLKGKKPYIVAESCSQCPTSYKKCSQYGYQNLCVYGTGRRVLEDIIAKLLDHKEDHFKDELKVSDALPNQLQEDDESSD